ncbi:T9SS type A sorting domain-containing protein [Spirosoma lituiforme]
MTLAVAQTNGPACDSYTNKTTANGLGDDLVRSVYANGNLVYVGTNGGLAISSDMGNTFINKTTANGLGSDGVLSVYAIGNTIYAGTFGGLSISTDGGNTFANKTTANGLGSNQVNNVYVLSNTVFAATPNGLGISTDGGNTFTNRTTANGLASNQTYGVFAVSGPVSTTVYVSVNGGLGISTDGGSTFTTRTTANGLGYNGSNIIYVTGNKIYVGTPNGLSISTDGGNTFNNKTTADGLGDNYVYGVYAIGNTVYAGTNRSLSPNGGLSISTDGGNTFTNKTMANGLGSNYVTNVYASGNVVYAATDKGLSLCTAAPLPVTLRYFNGRMANTGALLGWQTEHEANNDHFRIERSKDAIAFETIGNVPSQASGGSSLTSLVYTFIDANPLPGTNYYRLTQVDQDGTGTPSRIIALSHQDGNLVLYPNPVQVSGEVLLEPAVQYDQYQLIDAQGHIVKQSQQPGLLSRLSVHDLPVGVYILKAKSTTQLFIRQILVSP